MMTIAVQRKAHRKAIAPKGKPFGVITSTFGIASCFLLFCPQTPRRYRYLYFVFKSSTFSPELLDAGRHCEIF
jgi:hypothetical protein